MKVWLLKLSLVASVSFPFSSLCWCCSGCYTLPSLVTCCACRDVLRHGEVRQVHSRFGVVVHPFVRACSGVSCSCPCCCPDLVVMPVPSASHTCLCIVCFPFVLLCCVGLFLCFCYVCSCVGGSGVCFLVSFVLFFGPICWPLLIVVVDDDSTFLTGAVGFRLVLH